MQKMHITLDQEYCIHGTPVWEFKKDRVVALVRCPKCGSLVKMLRKISKNYQLELVQQ